MPVIHTTINLDQIKDPNSRRFVEKALEVVQKLRSGNFYIGKELEVLQSILDSTESDEEIYDLMDDFVIMADEYEGEDVNYIPTKIDDLIDGLNEIVFKLSQR